MKYAIYKPQAEKFIRKLPKNERLKIIDKIDLLAENSDALANNITKMQGETYNRLRVGKWRVIFTDDGEIIMIYEVFSRGKNYKP